MLSSFEAKFYDGETARPRQVIVELSCACLHIKAQDKSLQQNWPYNDIKILAQPVPPLPARLTAKGNPNARLYIEPGYWRQVRTKLPKNALPIITLSTNWNYLIVYAGLSVFVILGTVFFGHKLLDYASHTIPQIAEEKIGQLAIQSLLTNPECVEPQGRASLEKMAQKLQQGMARDIDIKVRVISDDETLNAFATPGGYLVIFSGVLKKADSANEVAGVLAHEMAHIEMNHPMKSLVRNLGVSLTLQMMAGNRDTISEIAKFAGIFRQLHYSRQDELEADFVGQRLLRKARIDPSGLKLFFERLNKADAANNNNNDEPAFPVILSYFSTHPHTQVRIDKLEPGKTNASAHEKALNEAEWHALKNICAQKADPD
ncbi:MAG: hypothetical protein NMNS01_08550 [Nitrosomonas sp.]|nr:MAG: hypothetical protein NMNS01_08550 [Nitrosomonas sp.]